MMSTSQNQPTTLPNESKLRQAAASRKERQWYIDTALRFKIYRTRFMNLLGFFTANQLPDTDPHVTSQLSSTLAKEIEAWEALETLLLEVPQISSVKAQPVHLPTTGDIPVEKMTSGRRNEHTTSPQYEEETDAYQALHKLMRECPICLHEYIDRANSQALHELMKECLICIREFYHAQGSPHMPHQITMGALNYFSLKSLCPDGYFPQTKVLIHLDLSLGDRMICE